MYENMTRTWAEVNLDHIAHNIREFRRITNKNSKILGVVKADGYGHGALEVSKVLLENGADRLAVAALDEALQLRKNLPKAHIMLLNYTDPMRAKEVIENDITQTCYSFELAKAFSDEAVRLKKMVNIHLKVDSGMTRVGFTPGKEAIKEILSVLRLPKINVEGIFTHFACADETDKSYTNMQFEKFMGLFRELEKNGVHIPIKHAANSAATIDCPEMHLDMVRPGISLYGLYPSDEVQKSRIDLRPAMTLKSKIILVKDVEENCRISYGGIFKTERKSKIATIPVGYADGYTRLNTGKGKAIVNGEIVPIVGKICMDQCMLDVSDVKSDVKVGDEVILFGKDKDSEISIDQVAKDIGTINYEIVCMVAKRVPRVYIKEEKVMSAHNYLV